MGVVRIAGVRIPGDQFGEVRIGGVRVGEEVGLRDFGKPTGHGTV